MSVEEGTRRMFESLMRGAALSSDPESSYLVIVSCLGAAAEINRRVAVAELALAQAQDTRN